MFHHESWPLSSQGLFVSEPAAERFVSWQSYATSNLWPTSGELGAESEEEAEQKEEGHAVFPQLEGGTEHRVPLPARCTNPKSTQAARR